MYGKQMVLLKEVLALPMSPPPRLHLKKKKKKESSTREKGILSPTMSLAFL